MHDQALLMQIGGTVTWIVIGVILIAALMFLAVAFRDLSLWVQSIMTRAGVGLLTLVTMRFRKVNAPTIVFSKIQLVKAGIHEVSTDDLESHYLAGGDVPRVSRAMIAANRANLELDWKKACAIDLAGRDISDAVRTSVDPKVIDVPNPKHGKQTIDAVAVDGIQLKAKARVTVRTNIRQLIGGATEETIIARVGEGIVSAIGSAQTYKNVLENPDRISKAVLAKGLDAGTAFEILSIDIADVDVGENIGATLQASQAEADKQVAQARAEVRRAAAVATEQEMSARTQEMRAKLVEAEAQIPMAIADAFRNGNLGVMDYAKYRNVLADTEMRANIAREVKEEEKGA